MVLDFTEIPNGEGFELLVRDMLVAMNYRVTWSGRGADQGKDLLVDEPGDGNFGAKPRRWLVSCKHNALANNKKGRSVSADDVGSSGGIADTVDEHAASGFLVACSTQPSSGLVQRLSSIENNKKIPTHYWDSETLRRWLNTPACWAIAQRHMPKSADGPRVYATEEPNKFIVISKGSFVRYANRHGSIVDFQLPWIEERIDAVSDMDLPSGFELRLRGVFYDDKHGVLEWYFDCLYQESDFYAIAESTTELEIARLIEHNLASRNFEDYQLNDYEVNMRKVRPYSDSYDPDHYSFYKTLPGYL
jgi:Restriction endonuclease